MLMLNPTLYLTYIIYYLIYNIYNSSVFLFAKNKKHSISKEVNDINKSRSFLLLSWESAFSVYVCNSACRQLFRLQVHQ